MMIYLIKSTTCLLILILVYHTLLEKEKMHVFNRFFLLFSVCFSLLVPIFQIEVFVDFTESLPSKVLGQYEVLHEETALLNSSYEETTDILSLGFFHIFYFVICLLLAIRFFKNLLSLQQRIGSNPQAFYKKAKLILLPEKGLPFTFMDCIFFHQEDYQREKIDERLLTHEYAHVLQKHTLDILFIEILLIFMWFNPLLYFYKKAIKINHEFLADEAVVQSHFDISAYQQLLLRQVCIHHFLPLISSLNYAITKKRLIMMTKNKSSRKSFSRIMVLVPLLLTLAYVFMHKSYAQQESDSQITETETPTVRRETQAISEKDSLRIVKDRYYGNGTARFGSKDDNGKYVYKSYHELTDEEREKLLPPPLSYGGNPPTQTQLNDFLQPTEYGVWLDGKRINNAELKNYQAADFGNFFISGLEKNAKNYGKYNYHVSLDTYAYLKALNSKLLKQLGIDEETMKLKL